MRKEILLAMLVSGALHAGLILGSGRSHHTEEAAVDESVEVDLTDAPKPPPPPPPATSEGDTDQETTNDLVLPDEFLAPGLSEPPASAVSMDVLAQFVKPEPPRPPRPEGLQTVGIPTGAQRAGAVGAKDSVVFSLEDLDRVPEPRYRVEPKYPMELKRSAISGQVDVFLVVDTTGKVIRAEVNRSTNAAFNQPAIDAVLRWRFEPGVKSGTPVPFRMILPIRFNVTS